MHTPDPLTPEQVDDGRPDGSRRSPNDAVASPENDLPRRRNYVDTCQHQSVLKNRYKD
jgi:hypothetical protein